jgi:hypothetical protein
MAAWNNRTPGGLGGDGLGDIRDGDFIEKG